MKMIKINKNYKKMKFACNSQLIAWLSIQVQIFFINGDYKQEGNRLFTEVDSKVMDAPSLEAFKTTLDGDLGSLSGGSPVLGTRLELNGL